MASGMKPSASCAKPSRCFSDTRACEKTLNRLGKFFPNIWMPDFLGILAGIIYMARTGKTCWQRSAVPTTVTRKPSCGSDLPIQRRHQIQRLEYGRRDDVDKSSYKQPISRSRRHRREKRHAVYELLSFAISKILIHQGSPICDVSFKKYKPRKQGNAAAPPIRWKRAATIC